MNERKKIVLALGLVLLMAVSPALAADDGILRRGFFASLESWIENLVAELWYSETQPPAAQCGGDGNEFMGLIIPGG